MFLEDAGFDWKVLGPDVAEVDYVAWQCDQDAYACSGQKCSAQSMLFMHDNWAAAGLEAKLAARAGARRLEDLTVGPVLSWTTDAMLRHADRLLAIPGARLAWGGRALEGHSIPPQYGAIRPTAVFVPLVEALKPGNYEAVTTEVFGPFQVRKEGVGWGGVGGGGGGGWVGGGGWGLGGGWVGRGAPVAVWRSRPALRCPTLRGVSGSGRGQSLLGGWFAPVCPLLF